MRTKSPRQIIQLVSLSTAVFGFIALILFWDSLTMTKKIVISLFIVLFILFILKTQSSRKNIQKKGYLTIDSATRKRTGPGSEKLNRIQGFLSQLGEEDTNDFYSSKKTPWDQNFLYASQKVRRLEPTQNYLTSYSNKLQLQKAEEMQQKNDLRLFVPQNINSIFQDIKERVSPTKYLKKFNHMVEDLRNYENKRQSNFSLQNYNQTFILDKHNNFLLEKDCEVFIRDQTYCAEEVREYLESKLQVLLNQAQANFRTVSQMVIKLFGIKVNFYINNRYQGDFDSKDVTISQLRDFLVRIRKDSFIPQKFKPNIPIKQFIQNHFDKLFRSTEAVINFLSLYDKQQEMAFQLYIQILNQQFKTDRIIITQKLSSISQQTQKIKHVFFFHRIRGQITFSYNRIKKFMTANPLICIIAYFAADFELNPYKNNQISRTLKKFFILKSRFTSSLGKQAK